MSGSTYYETLVKSLASRSVEATTSILGITNPWLRRHLAREFDGNGSGLGLLASPVFESIFPWEKGDLTMSSLAGKLLQSSLIEAMHKSKDHKFDKSWYPYKHQLAAWNLLTNKDNNQSVVVTSGTGSGKTECFLVPILNDLAQEYEQSYDPLVGVRALFLYPLNALINSQRDRLRAWTKDYDDGLRFCLYNGNTEENKHPDQGKYPNEILTRKLLRDEPAPMLVTNATMLEYMLVRQIDSPIIQNSQGKLRWIVLDEAHTYIGSQAAEISLLLRRVLHAFDVDAKDVRFVATSATIGDSESAQVLTSYLAKLAGISESQVTVIGGKRDVPRLPKFSARVSLTLADVKAIDAGQLLSTNRYNALSSHPVAIKTRELLTSGKYPLTLDSLVNKLGSLVSGPLEVLGWIDACSYTSNPSGIDGENTPFLPVRAHLLHEVLSGLWCCIDKSCTEKKQEDTANEWPFGYVYTKRKNHCNCGSPLLELAFCNDCNAPYLIGLEKGGRVVQREQASVDEFSLEISDEEGGGEFDDAAQVEESNSLFIVSPGEHELKTYPVSISKTRDIVSQGMESIDLNILDSEDVSCVSCGYSSRRTPFYRTSYLGTPFYISNSVPLLLDACQESMPANDLPSRGRRLITFTDSRQGTARISMKLQQDSERESLRGKVYWESVSNVVNVDPAEMEKLNAKRNEISEKIKSSDDDFIRSILEEKLAEINSDLSSVGQAKDISWSEMVSALAKTKDISRWMLDHYRYINPSLFTESNGPSMLAEMLLLREFARRPKRNNSLETLGLVSVQYPVLNEIDSAPASWKSLGKDDVSWREYLKVILDYYVREYSMISVEESWLKWLGAKIMPKVVLSPVSTEQQTARVQKWPQVDASKLHSVHKMARLLATAFNLDVKNPVDRDKINAVLRDAWGALTKEYNVKNSQTGTFEVRRILKNVPGDIGFHLDRRELAFRSVSKAYICPFTNRLMDVTLESISPYLPRDCERSKATCELVDSIPTCNVKTPDFDSVLGRKQAIRDWIKSKEKIEELRQRNLWTDVSDRVLEGGEFFRTGEHSAQQPARVLQFYEKAFKEGNLNVLSCSTTMEMGVDIGGISVVAMNNVPPHPANYLQRAGRAGRRGETQAVAFTICKDNPHERSVFLNPVWPFETSIPAPYVVLGSSRIVQRHVNSLFLAYFLKEEIKVTTSSITNLHCQWFFFADDLKESYASKMLRWLKAYLHHSLPPVLREGVIKITKDSILSGVLVEKIIEDSIASLQDAVNAWLPSYLKLEKQFQELAKIKDTDPFKRKVKFDLDTMGDAYLLSELASKGYLPGYGFPTGIATFDHYSIFSYKTGKYKREKSERIDNNLRMRERPGRDLPMAIREYAPGTTVVLDGLVYQSAGILMNKFAPDEDFSKPQKIMKEWRCHHCGFIGNESSATFDNACSDCGATLKEDNIKEYIEPEGFSVDFYSEPSTDIVNMFIKPQEAWVTANSGLERVFNHSLGVYRVSGSGHVFHHNSGTNGKGFAVCLKCGRADSMEADGDWPTTVRPNKHHNRLQGKPGPESQAACEGPSEPYAIKPNVHLGVANQTDVFELYLKDPNDESFLKHKHDDPLPWTLAVVLRQALADIHGINADEIGYTVKPSSLPTCNYSVAGIVLYDNAGGGAGFSSIAPRYLKEMLNAAKANLACVDHCDSACQSCLLGFDTRFHTDVLDRHVALEYLEKIDPFLELPREAKVFGEGTVYCLENLSAEILGLAAGGGSVINIFVGGEPAEWNFSLSNFKNSLYRWKLDFEEVNVVFLDSNLKSLTTEDKEYLGALKGLDISVNTVSKPPVLNLPGSSLLVQVVTGNGVISFGGSSTGLNIPGETWWNLDHQYLVHTKDLETVKFLPVDKSLLELESTGQGDVEVEIKRQLDGPLDGFGLRLWHLLFNDSPALKQKFENSGRLVKVIYMDSYVVSLWSFLLFSEMIDGLKKVASDKWENTRIDLVTGDKEASYTAKGYYSEWDDKDIMKKVMQSAFDEMDEQLNITVNDMKQMPHWRRLEIQWENGDKTFIRFDHGIGCWSVGSKFRDFVNLKDQVSSQLNLVFDSFRKLKVKYNNNYATQVFIKNRK